MPRLFIDILKEVAFEWFMKLPTGLIKTWADLKKLFLARFFEDDTEISMSTLLAAKQKKGVSIKTFVERFWSMALHYPSGMTQSILAETCHHNLQTFLLAQMGVVECCTWKQLVLQGEQAKDIVVRIMAEEKDNKSKPDRPMRHAPSRLLNREEEILWQQRSSHLRKPNQVERVWLPANHVLINCIPSRMSTWSFYSSYSKRVTNSNCQRSNSLKK